MEKFAADLIERLSKIFPPRCIHRGESPEEAHRYAGKVELVEALVSELEAELGGLPWKH